MDVLPPEIIAHVLGYARDNTAALVCRHWRDVALGIAWYRRSRSVCAIADMSPAAMKHLQRMLIDALSPTPPVHLLDKSAWPEGMSAVDWTEQSEERRINVRKHLGKDVVQSMYFVYVVGNRIHVRHDERWTAICACYKVYTDTSGYTCAWCGSTQVTPEVVAIVDSLRARVRVRPQN